jgi:hypothetical protein
MLTIFSLEVPYRSVLMPLPPVDAMPPEIVKINVSLVWAISQWNVVGGKYAPIDGLLDGSGPNKTPNGVRNWHDETESVSLS